MMEGSNLLTVLEKILLGRPGDSLKHVEYFSRLHESLLVANEATKRAALLTAQRLIDKNLINKEAGQKFIEYLKALKDQKSPIPPDLTYLTFSANPAARKASKIFHPLMRLSNKRTQLLQSGLESFKKRVLLYKNHQISIYQSAENKVQKMKKIIYFWIKVNNVFMHKVLIKWRFFNKLSPRRILLNCARKSEMRYFYLKHLVVERWIGETWVVEEENHVWGDEEFNHSTSSQKIAKMNSSLNLNNIKLSEILFFVTRKIQFSQNSGFDYKVQTLSNLIFREKDQRSQLGRVARFMKEVLKQKKQIRYLGLSKWSERFVEIYQKEKKFELALEVLKKKVVEVQLEVLRNVQEFVLESDKVIDRKIFEDLMKNSLKFEQAPRAVLEKLKAHQENTYQIKVRYTKSVLSSVFKATKNTQIAVMNTWKLLKSSKELSEKTKKVKKFIKALASSLNSASKFPLKFPALLQKRKTCLSRCFIHTFRNLRVVLESTFQKWQKSNRSLVNDRKTLKKLVLYSLARIIKSQLHRSLATWKKHQTEELTKTLSTTNTALKKNLKKKSLRSSKASASNLLNTLKSISTNRILRSSFNSIINRTSENYTKKLIKGLITHFNKNLLKVIRTWENTAKELKKHELTTRLSVGSIVRSSLSYLSNHLTHRVKSYFQLWVNSLHETRRRYTSHQLRCLKLIKMMHKIPARFLKISLMRIIGIISKIERAMENLYFSMKRKPKHSFDTWRFNAAKIRKINMLNRLRAEKLCRVLIRVPGKKLRRTFNSVVGTSIKIKQAMRNLIDCIRKKLREAIGEWRGYCTFCNQAELDLDFRLHQFCALLRGPVKKPLRSAFSDLKPNWDGAVLKGLVRVFEKGVGFKFRVWRSRVSEIKMQRLYEDRLAKFLDLNRNERIEKLVYKLVAAQKGIQKAVISALYENKRRKDLIRKVNAVYRLYKVLKIKPKIMVKNRFNRWKHFENRKVHLLISKVIVKWIFASSISYQSSFWRLKYASNQDLKSLSPIHALIVKKLNKFVSGQQLKLKQYALFELMVYYNTMTNPFKQNFELTGSRDDKFEIDSD